MIAHIQSREICQSMIPKQVKKRHPDELVLATFRIPYEKWEKFQEAASASGTTASATLLAFIEDYLARFNAGNQPELLDSFDSPVDSSLEAEVEVPVASQLPEQSPVNSGLAISEVPELNRDFIRAMEPQIQKLLEAKIQEKLEAKIEKQLEARIEARIEEKLEAKIEDIEPIIHRIQSQVSQLSKRLDKVEQIVDKFKGAKTKKDSDFIDVAAVPIDGDLHQHNLEKDRPLTEDEQNDIGLTQTALCIEFGINPNTLNRHASVRGLSTVEYLHQLTGWLYRNGKYYPPK